MVDLTHEPVRWRCGRFSFEWQNRLPQKVHIPLVMGILNVTPDSFSDGGKFFDHQVAIDHAYQMIEDGAHIIDIGGESSKPGAEIVSDAQEQDRVMPVIEALQGAGVALSLDSYKSSTMAVACKAGIDILNDITGFASEQNQRVAVANPNVGICIMHMQNSPQNMQIAPQYHDVLLEVRQFFLARIDALENKGVLRDRICLDPGFGFGKTPAHNLRLLNQLKSFTGLDLPMLIGVSRKSTLGKILGNDTENRMIASVAAMLSAIEQGAKIVRVHDVKESVQAIKVWMAIKNESF